MSPVVTHGPRERRAVALTFDADMTPKMARDLRAGKVQSWYDAAVVACLERHAVAATFFVTGLWAGAYPEAVTAWARNPRFEIGNHGYSHAAFHTPCHQLPAAEDKRAEIAEAQRILTELTGRAPRFFRFPGGCCAPDDVSLVEAHGLQVVGWDVASGDAFSADREAIVRGVLAKAAGGSIIVMHLSGGRNAPATAGALPAVIEALRRRGFGFATVGELIGGHRIGGEPIGARPTGSPGHRRL